VLAADVLLRRINRVLPHALPRAYADDLALVTNRLEQDLPKLVTTFMEYERLSGLALNLSKTVLVPLWDKGTGDAQAMIDCVAPVWGAIRIQEHAEYLGFILGPAAKDRSWLKPLRKFEDRAREWGAVGGGMHLTLLAYAVYIFPVLGFVAQLRRPPAEWAEVERRAASRLFPGPLGLYRGVEALARPALQREPDRPPHLRQGRAMSCSLLRGQGRRGLMIEARARDIHTAFQDSEFFFKMGSSVAWWSDTAVSVLHNNLLKLSGKGINRTAIMHRAKKATMVEARRSWQKSTRQLLEQLIPSPLPIFVRRKLER